MPAIGASTTGTGTVSGPRVRGMHRLSGGDVARTKLVVPTRSADRLLLDDRPLPGDRVEVLGRAEADRDQLPVVGGEVDQADRRPLAVCELRRQRPARARRE